MCPKRPPILIARGFSLVTAIFILVILASLGAFMVTFSTTQHTTAALDVQSVRALQVARAGIEWGAYEALQGSGFVCADAPATTNYSMTFSSAPSLNGFTSAVVCSKTSHNEGGNIVVIYNLTSTANYGVANTSDYVSRQITARVAK